MTKKQQFEHKFFEDIDQQLRDMDEELASLKAQVDEAGQEAQDRYNSRLTKLQEQRAGLENKIQAWRNSGSSAADDIQTGMQKAWDDLKLSFEQARSEFRDQDQ